VQDWNDVTSELQPEDRRRLVEIARRRMGAEPLAEDGTQTGSNRLCPLARPPRWDANFWNT